MCEYIVQYTTFGKTLLLHERITPIDKSQFLQGQLTGPHHVLVTLSAMNNIVYISKNLFICPDLIFRSGVSGIF